MLVRAAICLIASIGAAVWLDATTVAAPQGTPVIRPAVTAGGYVYISTIRPSITTEDIAAQTRDVVAQLKATLEASGSSIEQLCHVQVALKRSEDFAAMNVAYADVIGPNPPARTTVVSWLRGSTLIEISAVAVPNGAYREVEDPDGWAKNTRPYSYIVKTEDLVFFAGLLSRKGSDDSVVKGNIKTQTMTILDNVGTLLETVELTYDDIVSARVFLSSPYDFPDMNAIYGGYFPTAPPARATAVAELMNVDNIVEISMIASRRPKTVIGGQAANGFPVSLAVAEGPRVWMSAVIGDTDKHTKVGDQTRDAFVHLKTTLAEAGLGLGDLVDTAVYMRDTFEMPEVDKVYRELFPANPPSRNSLGTRLVVDPALIEVLALAVRK